MYNKLFQLKKGVVCTGMTILFFLYETSISGLGCGALNVTMNLQKKTF